MDVRGIASQTGSTGDNPPWTKSFFQEALEPAKPPSNPTPGYFRMVREGDVLPVTGWTREFLDRQREGPTSFSSRTVGLNRYALSSECHTSGDFGWAYAYAPLSAPPPVDEDLAGRLLQEATARAKTASWDILTFAKEADKTYGMLRGAHSRFLNRVAAVFSAAKGKGGGRAGGFAAFASAWLEYRYGWRTLAYDLEDAQASVQHLQRQHDRLIRKTAYDVVSDSNVIRDKTGLTAFYMPGPGSASSTGALSANRVTRTDKVSYRAGAGFVESRFFPFTFNPLVTLWEVIPYSFIVDWFVNVGDAIAAHTLALGKFQQYLWLSRRVESTTVMTTSFYPKPPTYGYRYEVDACSVTDRVTRTFYVREPRTHVPFNISFSPNLDLSKFADLSALAVQEDADLLRKLR